MKKLLMAVLAMGMFVTMPALAEEISCPWEIVSVVFSPKLPGEGSTPHVELHFKDSNNLRPAWKKRVGEEDVDVLLREYGGNEANGLVGVLIRECEKREGIVGVICRTP